MAKIEDSYVKNFVDRFNWDCMVWLYQTDKGGKLALELYHSDDPDNSDQHAP